MCALAAGAVLLANADARAITLPDNSSCNTTGTNGCFRITNTNTGSAANAIKGETSGNGIAVTGTTATTGTGVKGISASGPGVNGTSTSGTGVSATSSTGSGVVATATSTSGAGNAVQGTASGSGVGVRGIGNGTGGGAFKSKVGAGVYGSSVSGDGVYGEAVGTGSGDISMGGVLGYSSRAFVNGVMGIYQGGDNQVAAVKGIAVGAGGPSDFTAPGVGVHGLSGSTGVQGDTFGGMGVFGRGQPGIGVYGQSDTPSGTGCNWGEGCDPGLNHAVGVFGLSENVTGTLIGGTGLYGLVAVNADTTSAGVRGDAQSGAASGVIGVSGTGSGVIGNSGGGVGVQAISINNAGLVAQSSTWSAITAITNVSDTSAPGIASYTGSTSTFAFWGGGGIHLDGSVAEKPGGGTWTATSDRRVKKDVSDFQRGIGDLMRVRPVRFKYNGLGGTDDNGKEFVGVIAQELEQIAPSMVRSRSAKLHKEDANATEIKVVDPSDFTYMLINAVKQQQRTIEKQDARIADLERRSSPIASSVLPTGLGGWALLALLPIGMFVGRRRSNRS